MKRNDIKNYGVILFDLDGTLTNPEHGLIEGFVYALSRVGVDYGERASLCRFIGPPLFSEWQSEFGFTPDESREAIRLLREPLIISGRTRSFIVIERMIASVFAICFSSICASFSAPALTPGSIPTSWLRLPIFLS